MKHLTDIKRHYVLECHLKGQIIVSWIRSEEQRADILTKALPKQAFQYLRSFLIG